MKSKSGGWWEKSKQEDNQPIEINPEGGKWEEDEEDGGVGGTKASRG